ncbi:MAG: M23 family metallopeptidase [Nocardioidaceae bacterium]
MRRPITATVAILLAVLAPGTSTSAAERATDWGWPLDPVPHVVRFFEPPESPYGPGHRGVDLAGSAGQPVLAVGGGTVGFAGSVAGRGVIVVDHGALRSTYQPATALVPVGAQVVAGQPIGSLQAVHSHCAPAICLHLGVRRGESYLDPLRLLPARPVRLKPLEGLDHGVEPGRLLPPSPGGASGARAGLLAGRGP